MDPRDRREELEYVMGKSGTEPTVSHLLRVLRDSRSNKDRELREAVLSTVVRGLDGETCSAVLRAADDMGCHSLRKASMNHIISNFDAAVASSNFFYDLSPTLLVDVLKHVSIGAEEVTKQESHNNAHTLPQQHCMSAPRNAKDEALRAKLTIHKSRIAESYNPVDRAFLRHLLEDSLPWLLRTPSPTSTIKNDSALSSSSSSSSTTTNEVGSLQDVLPPTNSSPPRMIDTSPSTPPPGSMVTFPTPPPPFFGSSSSSSSSASLSATANGSASTMAPPPTSFGSLNRILIQRSSNFKTIAGVSKKYQAAIPRAVACVGTTVPAIAPRAEVDTGIIKAANDASLTDKIDSMTSKTKTSAKEEAQSTKTRAIQARAGKKASKFSYVEAVRASLPFYSNQKKQPTLAEKFGIVCQKMPKVDFDYTDSGGGDAAVEPISNNGIENGYESSTGEVAGGATAGPHGIGGGGLSVRQLLSDCHDGHVMSLADSGSQGLVLSGSVDGIKVWDRRRGFTCVTILRDDADLAKIHNSSGRKKQLSTCKRKSASPSSSPPPSSSSDKRRKLSAGAYSHFLEDFSTSNDSLSVYSKSSTRTRISSLSNDDRVQQHAQRIASNQIISTTTSDSSISGGSNSDSVTSSSRKKSDSLTPPSDVSDNSEEVDNSMHTIGTTLSLLVLPTVGLVVSGSRDCSIRLWDLGGLTWCCMGKLNAHTDSVQALSLWDGNAGCIDVVASGSADKTICVWDFSGRNQWSKQFTLRGHKGGVKALVVARGQLLSGSFDRTIRVWNRRTGNCDDVLTAHTSGITALSVYNDGCKFASTSSDDSVRLWTSSSSSFSMSSSSLNNDRMCNGEPSGHSWICTARLTGHECTIWALCSYGRWLLSGDENGMLKVWDTTTGRCEGTSRQSERSTEPIATLAVTVDGDIMSSSWDGSIAFWHWNGELKRSTTDSSSSDVSSINDHQHQQPVDMIKV